MMTAFRTALVVALLAVAALATLPMALACSTSRAASGLVMQ